MKFTSAVRDELIKALESFAFHLPQELKGKAYDLASKVRRLETTDRQSVSVPEQPLSDDLLRGARALLDPSPSNFNRNDNYLGHALEKKYGRSMLQRALAQVRAQTGWE